ncbi:MAG: hypothetical protein QNJ13_09415 [Paracoccaceae bacterium]|nr:hypothetical protein [Paracoccaceae bacterium]
MPREGTVLSKGSDAPAMDAGRLAAAIAADESALLRAYFVSHGAAPPRLTWSPPRSALTTPILRSFADVVDGFADASGFLAADRLRLEDFDGLERWIMVLTKEGDHFCYEHYGAEITSHYGVDMTGRSTADFGRHRYIGVFFAAVYTAAIARRERVLSVHEPPLQVFVRVWRRLIVPMVNAADDITGFVVANVADNELRAGLEMIVDPVIVSERDGTVRYCNDAAQTFFGIPSGHGEPLVALTGFDISGLPAPEILLTRREIVESLELVERPGGVMERLTIAVSAAEHRGRAYYVILVRANASD